MKFAIVVILASMVSMALAGCSKDEFEAFRRQYRKDYSSEEEAQLRCEIYTKNRNLVNSHNLRYARGLETHTVEINKFADMTNEEFLSYYAGLKPSLDNGVATRAVQFQYDPNHKAAASVDWRTKGVVSPVKNQARCGSCWSFASVAALEAHYAIKYKKQNQHLDLSEQQGIECSGSYGNQACQGGLMKYYWDYMLKTGHGIHLEENYPYISGNGNNGSSTCQHTGQNTYAKIVGWTDLSGKNDDALAQAVELHGPVAVGINAGGDAFQLYKSGTYCPGIPLLYCSSLGVNHAVLLVGYTPDAWIIKNSWGTEWGAEEGYVYICRKYSGMCGITRMPSFPIMA